MTHVRDVLNTACLAAQCLQREEAAVLLTDNTGTDLSLVISSLAQIILNPDTRTLHGLQALIEREWILGGHPFWTRHAPARAGHEGQAPVFLLFLDCVMQVYNQFPCSFQFTEKLLISLADHSLASSFGTFLCDGEREREEAGVRQETVSLWSFINQIEILSHHLNCLYLPNKVRQSSQSQIANAGTTSRLQTNVKTKLISDSGLKLTLSTSEFSNFYNKLKLTQ